MPSLVKSYWKDKLGLNAGAPAVLYAIIGSLEDDRVLDHERIFRRSLRDLRNEPGEMQKIQRILDIEPFLSYTEYVARFFSQASIKKIHDVKADLQQIRTCLLYTSRCV